MFSVSTKKAAPIYLNIHCMVRVNLAIIMPCDIVISHTYIQCIHTSILRTKGSSHINNKSIQTDSDEIQETKQNRAVMRNGE